MRILDWLPRRSESIERREWLWALLGAFALSLIISGPVLYATCAPSPGMRFTGSLEYYFYFDANTYLGWILQASNGYLLFANPYTTEATGRNLFHPLFLGLGLLVRWLGLPTLAVWAVARLVCAFAASVTLYFFARALLPDRAHAITGALIVALAAGFGWEFVYVDRPQAGIDYTMPELTFFQSLRYPFLFAVALTLMMTALYGSFAAIARHSRRGAILAGITVAALAIVHPYDVVTVASITVVFLVVESVRRRAFDWKAFALCCLTGVISAPAVLAQAYLAYVDPVLAAPARVPVLSPFPLSFIAGYGPILLTLACLGARAAWRDGVEGRFLVVWAVAGACLLYAPVVFQRRLALGLIIPIGFIAAFRVLAELKKILSASGFHGARLATGLVLLLALMLPTNVLTVVEDWQAVRDQKFPYFIANDMSLAFDWLASAPRGVVLAEDDVANLIPAFTGQTVFSGHWGQTFNYKEKYIELTLFLAGRKPGAEGCELIERSRARYIFYGPQEKALKEISQSPFEPEWYGRIAFESGDVRIVEVGPCQPPG